MQVELIGCTSAGKSTLATAMAEAAHEEGIDFSLGDDVLLKQIGLRSLRNKSVRAALVHLIAAVACLLFSWRNIAFIRLSNRVLKHAGIPLRQRLHQLRKVLKQLGRYELVSRRHGEKEIVLVDEGTVHAAHNIFVHQTAAPREEDIQGFADIVPLPDLVIYLSVPDEDLIERTLRRGHARITVSDREVTANFLRRAVTTFDQLSQHDRIVRRLLIVREGQIVSGLHIPEGPGIDTLTEVLKKAIQSVAEKSSEGGLTKKACLKVIS